MHTQTAFDALEARRVILDAADDTYGSSQAVTRLAEVREATMQKARDAVGTLAKSAPESDVEAIVAVVIALSDKDKAKLAALPAPAPQATEREKLIVALQTYEDAEAEIRASAV